MFNSTKYTLEQHPNINEGVITRDREGHLAQKDVRRALVEDHTLSHCDVIWFEEDFSSHLFFSHESWDTIESQAFSDHTPMGVGFDDGH